MLHIMGERSRNYKRGRNVYFRTLFMLLDVTLNTFLILKNYGVKASKSVTILVLRS